MNDAPIAETGVREGDILAGKYRIDKVLGEGGMGVVVAAHHIDLDEKVAIKFLLPEALHNREAVARFAREARAAVKIKSEHVVRVSDVGTLENGAPYMVMEFLEGWDLHDLVRRTGPLPIEQAVEFILQTCEAIADAHGLGIVHRDLKPANLFCIRRSDGLLAIKVLDFGISKMIGTSATGHDLGMTKTTAVMGSPLYMSPEQLRSAKDVDTRTDIWAIGVILYELLTGRVPFAADTIPELSVKIVTEPPVPLRERLPDVPPDLEQVIMRCLEKDRNDRYANVADLAIALAKFGPKRSRASIEKISRVIHHAGLATGGPALLPSLSPPKDSRPPTLASWGQTSRSLAAVGGRAWLLTGGLVAVLAIAGAGFVLGRRGSAPAPVATPAGLVAPVAPAAVAPTATANVTAEPAPASAPTSAPSAAAEPDAGAPVVAVPAKPAAPAAPTKVKKAAAKPATAAEKPTAPAPKRDDLGGRL